MMTLFYSAQGLLSDDCELRMQPDTAQQKQEFDQNSSCALYSDQMP